MQPTETPRPVGVSGLSLYVPRPRVNLEDWCAWTGTPWAKIRRVVGHSFRMPAPHEDAYTMAAQAALRLIEAYDLDPQRVGFLGLGTESSKDNSAGAVIVRGMLDRALVARGRAPLARDCEVPEFKHACLGGMYGLKAALRYVATDGAARQAIVIASDVAEYARGSSGEPTQGAGAVAMLVEADPQLFQVDLAHAGSASAYRGPDFRKPFARHFLGEAAGERGRPHDFPVFSGRYSTFAYLDETVHAVDHLLAKLGVAAKPYYRGLRALFFHRPYAMMPVQGVAFLLVRALLGEFNAADADRERLDALCAAAGVALADVRAEAARSPDLFGQLEADGAPADPYPATSALANHLRKSAWFKELMGERLDLGAAQAMELGNLYTASLPAWLAAGFEAAAGAAEDLAGAPMLAVGYGSGDAAEAWPIAVAPGWRKAAEKIGFAAALADPMDLSEAEYAALHGGRLSALPQFARQGFHIDRVGDRDEPGFQDLGVDYYAFTG